MSTYLKNAAKRVGSPKQKERLNERQVENSEGGFVFEMSDWMKLDRFLILGTEGGSYYAGEKELTEKNVKAVKACIKEDGEKTVARVVEISHSGRAPKNDPALFVLALCTALGNEKTKRAAFNALPKVARIGTHLFHFAQYADSFRGWGRGLRNAIGAWYTEKKIDSLQNQLVKYQARDGWSHRDLLRLAHPTPSNDEQAQAFRWVTNGKWTDQAKMQRERLALIDAFEQVKGFALDSKQLENKAADEKERLVAKHVRENEKTVAKLVTDFELTREMVPTEFQNSKVVWEAIFEKMPMTAMIRNLANMTRAEILAPMSDVSKEIVKRLHDEDMLKKARIHPIQVLMALKTYGAGIGVRSRGEGWKPVQKVVDALNDAFYLAFKTIEPTGKNWYLGVDVSGSMGGGNVAGCLGLSPREAAAAMALVTARTEENYVIRGFADSATGRRLGKKAHKSMHSGYDVAMAPLDISPKQRLDDVVRITSNIPFGGTDCALPMLDALEDNLPIDVFCVLTDSETWAGNIHPVKALEMYRNKTGRKAKLIVVGMVANEFSIADPEDPGMLDVVGFDAAAPAVMADFARN
jgi:60 kDa SS-A/Ro ribonucleoprotein